MLGPNAFSLFGHGNIHFFTYIFVSRFESPGESRFQCCGSGSGIGCLFDPWIRNPGWEKVSIRIQDEQPGSYFLELRNHFFAFLGVKILKFFDEDPGSGMETVRIRDPGWKKVGSATLPDFFEATMVTSSSCL